MIGEEDDFSLADLQDAGPAPIDQPEYMPPPKLKEKPVGGAITIKEIVGCLMDEASRINTAEGAAVDMGWRKEPDKRQKRRETLFVAAADMLARLEPHQHEIKHILSRDHPKKKTSR